MTSAGSRHHRERQPIASNTATVSEWIREKYVAILPELDERGRRRWAAIEARSLGWGGVAAVAAATGMSDRTIRTGIHELQDPQRLSPDRQRRQGGGRHLRQRPLPVSYGTTPLCYVLF